MNAGDKGCNLIIGVFAHTQVRLLELDYSVTKGLSHPNGMFPDSYRIDQTLIFPTLQLRRYK